MEELANILDQARRFTVTELEGGSSAWITNPLIAGVLILVLGIAVSVLGARFARAGLTTLFALLGGSFGMWFADLSGFAPLICVLSGALLLGVIGFQTFHLWIGVGAAIVFSSIAMGAYGYHQVLPHVVEYQQTASAVDQTPEGTTNFTVPSLHEQSHYLVRDPRLWARDFWGFLTDNAPSTANNARAVAIVSLLTGLCMGLIAVRLALILATSIVGTSLVTTGFATLATHSVPETYQAFNRSPVMLGVVVGGFLLTSLILQTILSRKGASDKAESKDRS